MFPAVVADHQPTRVQGAGQVIERPHVVAVNRVGRQIRHAPALVERNPRHDARMRSVAVNHLHPLAGQSLDGPRRKAVGTGHLLPHQQTQHVAPVQPAGVFDLLVFSGSVEAQPLGQLHVAAQLLVSRRHQPLRPVALVEDHLGGVGLTVEQEALSVGADRAQGCITLYLVDHPFAVEQFDGRLNKLGMLGTPQQVVAGVVDAGVGNGDAAAEFTAGELVGVVGQFAPLGVQAHAHLQPGDQRAAQLQVELQFPAVQPGRPAERLQMGLRQPFEPHALPDAGGARIPDQVRLGLPVLFATGLGQFMRIVLGAHHQPGCAVLAERPGDVHGKWGVAAFMLSDEVPPRPHLRGVVHRPEMHQQPSPPFVGLHRKLTGIPHHRVKTSVMNAAEDALRGIRHLDGPVEDHVCGLLPVGQVVMGKLPLAVEAAPGRALELGPGMGRCDVHRTSKDRAITNRNISG